MTYAWLTFWFVTLYSLDFRTILIGQRLETPVTSLEQIDMKTDYLFYITSTLCYHILFVNSDLFSIFITQLITILRCTFRIPCFTFLSSLMQFIADSMTIGNLMTCLLNLSTFCPPNHLKHCQEDMSCTSLNMHYSVSAVLQSIGKSYIMNQIMKINWATKQLCTSFANNKSSIVESKE